MKKTITFLLLLSALSGYAQTDTIIYYDSLPVFSMSIDLPYGTSDTLMAPVIIYKNYDCVTKLPGIWHVEPQFVMRDSIWNPELQNYAVPNIMFQSLGARSNGTVWDLYIDSITANDYTLTLDSIFNIIEEGVGVGNINKLY